MSVQCPCTTHIHQNGGWWSRIINLIILWPMMHFLIKNWVANPQNVENVNILVRVSSLLHINLNHVVFNTRRKTCIFDYSLRLNFSRKRHFATKNPFNRLRQVACDKLVANDKGYCMKKKSQQIHFILWLHCIRIVTCD